MSLTQPTKVTWTLARPPRYQNPGQNNTQEGIGALLISLPKEVKRAPITPHLLFVPGVWNHGVIKHNHDAATKSMV